MSRNSLSQQLRSCVIKDTSKQRHKLKQLLAKPKQYETISLNQSEVKHLHAIRPYCPKQKKSAKRESRHAQSPYEMSRSKSKRFDGSLSRNDQGALQGKKMGDMLTQLIHLKSQYKMLKENYNKTLSERNQQVKKQNDVKAQMHIQIQAHLKQIDRSKKVISASELQIQRIKKQCYKILEIERFRYKKLQQIVQQKQLMISYLRNQNQMLKKGKSSQNSMMMGFPNPSSLINFDYFSKQGLNHSCLSSIPEQMMKFTKKEGHYQEDSLSLSRDKSKDLDSVIYSFLSNHDQSLHMHTHQNKKDMIINKSLEESPIEAPIETIDERSQHSQKQSTHQVNSKEQSTMRNKSSMISQYKAQSVIQELGQIASTECMRRKRGKKQLHIIITDENTDQNNIQQDSTIDTKRKAEKASIKPRKKTAKKAKLV